MARQPLRDQLLVLDEARAVTVVSPEPAAALPFLRNPLVEAAVLERDGVPERLELSAYSAIRGFDKVSLARDENPAFETALRLLGDPDALPHHALPDTMLALWAAGLLVLPQERVASEVPPPEAETVAAFRARGFAELPPCVAPAMRKALVQHYTRAIEAGRLTRGADREGRYTAHNDPAGRIVQKMLLPLVAAIVGAPIKPSYTFASLYCGGADLPVHRDRPQCEYTLSLLIDHGATRGGPVAPWPVLLYPPADRPAADRPPEDRPPEDRPVVECRAEQGGGLLFRGREIPHGRRPLPADETCWVMLLHYVDADFAGSLA